MPFIRPLSYYEKRFHRKQFEAWKAYKAGLNLFLAWSRRSGKSNTFTEIMVEDIEDRGHDCLYVAKTQKQARRIIWKKFFSVLHGQSGWKLNESRLEAVYKGGPLISVKGADLSADNLAGAAYRIIACDEFALWRKPSIVKEILAPMLADHEGQMLYGSTKRGKNHFYDLHQLALGEPKKYFVSEATMFDNTFMTEKGRQIVLSEYSGENDPLYQQEILNKYVSFEGMAFALPESDYIVRRWDPADLEFSYHWRGMDHGYSPDPTAVVWIAYNNKFKYYLVYSDYEEKQLLIYDHAKAIVAQEPYQIIDTFSDIDPQLIAEYGAVGLSLTMANKTNKDAKILRLVNHMRTGQLKIASCCKKLLKELQSYEWGQDGDDHLVDALNYNYSNLVLPPQTEKKKDTLPKHTSKSNMNHSNRQSFGDDNDDSNVVIDDDED